MTLETIQRRLLDLGIPADVVGFKYISEILLIIKSRNNNYEPINLTKLCHDMADKYDKNYMSIYVGITSLLNKYRKVGTASSLHHVFGENYSTSSNITATTFINCLLMVV